MKLIMNLYELFEIINMKLLITFNSYQMGLTKSMKGSDFVFYFVDRLCYKCRQVSLDCGRSYTDFPD